MRLKRASLTFAGAAAAVAVTTMAASPAWACNDRDPALKLRSLCGKAGPAWMLSNPNGWGAVPATWVDNKGGHSEGKISVPAHGSVALPTHATKVIVTAFRPDRGRQMPVWQRHGAVGSLLSCKATKPTAPPSDSKPKPAPKPTKAKEAPKPVTPPSGEAKPATPVKAQPEFTG
jgi:hypothetical protein